MCGSLGSHASFSRSRLTASCLKSQVGLPSGPYLVTCIFLIIHGYLVLWNTCLLALCVSLVL